MPDSIQLGEYSMSSGIDGVLYITATGMVTSASGTSYGRRQVALELQLARQRLERQQPRGG